MASIATLLWYPMNITFLAQDKANHAQLSNLKQLNQTVILGQESLTVEQVVRVARYGTQACISDEQQVLQRVESSSNYIAEAVANGQPIYGVTSGFGGMANVVISPESAAILQNNLIRYHKTGTGNKLPLADVRAAMLLRMNSHLQGASGIRLELYRWQTKSIDGGGCI